MSQVSLLAKAFAEGLRPEPDVSVSEWSARYRVLVQTASAEPGLWRNERTPYLTEIMDCLSPFSGIEQVSVMKGAQGGFTEAGNNWMGFVVHRTPGPMLYVQPTVDTVKKYSKMRLAPMIEACEVLRERIRESRSRDSGNTQQMKEFPGGMLILTGANSASGLRSMPIRFLFMDEIDAYPLDVDGEGDPIELAEKRTSTFRNRKILKVSTPTLVGLSHIERSFKTGDQRQWWVPCPFCQQTQVLRWRVDPKDDRPGGIVWKWGDPSSVRYQCEHCLKEIPEHRKTWMNNSGVWIPQNPECDPKIRSYHWPSLYSPYGWPGASWPELVKKWEAGKNDPTKKKTFFNLELGLPFEDETSRQAEPHVLAERCEYFPPVADDGALVVPDDVCVVTMGADVQPDRIEYEKIGWGRGEESWSIAYGVVIGDTQKPDTWVAFQEAISQKIRNESGVLLVVEAVCVDSNFNTQAVTTWCGPRFNRRIWATRGAAGNRPIWPRRPGANKYNKTPLFTLGVDKAKEAVIGRLTIAEPGPGYCHFPVSRDIEYFVQLTSEVCVTEYDKVPPRNVWKKKSSGLRNEALDCRVYGFAALCGLVAGGFRIDAEADDMVLRIADMKAVKQPTEFPTAARPSNSWVTGGGRGRGNWFQR